MSTAVGPFRHMAFLIFNETHFNREQILKERCDYTYFRYADCIQTVNSLYERVMRVCSHVYLRDPMGNDKRMIDIFGYTPEDVLRHDYASFVELEDRLSSIEKEYDEDMKAKTKLLETMKQQGLH